MFQMEFVICINIFVCVSSWVRAGFEPGSSRIRDISNPFKIYIDTVFDISRIGSKPTRSVRMQWSKTYQMVVPYAPVWIRNLLVFRTGFEPYSTCIRLAQIHSKEIFPLNGFEYVSNTSRIQLEPGSKRSNAME